MRIVVVDIAARGGGANTILEGLYRHATTRGSDHQWIFLLGERYLPDAPNAHTLTFPAVRSHWGLRLAFDFLTGERIINALRPDVVLSLQNTTVTGVDCPQILYLHQSLPFFQERRYSFLKPKESRVALYQRAVGGLIKRSVRRADRVVVQTAWLRDAIVEAGVHPARVVQVLPDLEPELLDLAASPNGRDPNLFVCPTAAWAYKNTHCVLEAARILTARGLAPSITVTLPDGPPIPGVRYVGNVSREAVLRELTRGTLLFPSRVESYGLPLAEARALGAPVLAADRHYAHEVLAGYPNARFFDPDAPAELASQMAESMDRTWTPMKIESLPPTDPPAWDVIIDVIADGARSQPRVFWLTNIPSPYRVDFFNELGKYCDLTVLFERRSSTHRGQTWDTFEARGFRAKFLHGVHYSSSASVSPGVLVHLVGHRHDHVVVSNFSSVTGALAVLFLRGMGTTYHLESDGAFVGPTTGLRAWLKRLILPGAAGYFSTAAEHDQYYISHGAPPDRIIRYPFTSIRRAEVRDRPPTEAEQAAARQDLGITERRVVLSIGQFVHRKGFDVLLNACASLPDDVGVYVVGGEPSEEYIQLVVRLGLTRVHFKGFQPREVLHRWFESADVFVLPTREDIWGLVVNESLALGLPVVTTDRCIAGLELVQPGVTGEIVPVDNAVALSEALRGILEDSSRRAQMRTAALARMRSHTLEDMVKAHLCVLAPNAAATVDGGAP